MKTYPEHWFLDARKITVIENVDYYTRKGTTTITIYYKQWWKLRRKLRFARTRTSQNSNMMHQRSPIAQAIIEKLKETLRPSFKRALYEHEGPLLGSQGDLAFFYRFGLGSRNGQSKDRATVHWTFEI